MMVFLYNGEKGGIFVKVLVIGGSYFLGRVLTMSLSKQWDMTLVNRGHYSILICVLIKKEIFKQ